MSVLDRIRKGGDDSDAPAPDGPPASRPGGKGRARKPKPAKPEPAKPKRNPLAGARGGRGLYLVGRVVLWGVLVVVFLAGVLSIFRPSDDVEALVTDAFASQETAIDEPTAEAFAARFARTYLTWDSDPADESGQEVRAARLAAYLPPADGDSGQFGWDGSGRQRVQQVLPVDVTVTGPTTAITVVDVELVPSALVEVDGEDQDSPVPQEEWQEEPSRWVRLAVPLVWSPQGGYAVSGQPAYVASDGLVAEVSRPSVSSPDNVTAAALVDPLSAFFVAYGSGDATGLSFQTTDGAGVIGLGGQVEFAALGEVVVPEGGDSRTITADVLWRQDDAQVEQTYRLDVVRSGGLWRVAAIAVDTADPLTVPAFASGTVPTSTSDAATPAAEGGEVVAPVEEGLPTDPTEPEGPEGDPADEPTSPVAAPDVPPGA